MRDVLLSIIIPVYNVENYLRECLESVLRKQFEELEIILVNDGSTDGSEQICKEYSNRYSNVLLINQKNGGLSAARNTGINYARGKYLLFLDSDDLLMNNSLDSIVELLKKSEYDFWMGRAYKFIDGSNKYELCQVNYDVEYSYEPYKEFIKLDSIDDFWFAAWLIIIKREYLINMNLFFMPGIYHEDELWVPSVFAMANSCGFVNLGFYGYRLNRTGSIVNTPSIKREFDKLIIVDEFDKLKIDENAKEMIKRRQAALVFGIIIKLNAFNNNPEYGRLVSKLKKNRNKLNFGKYKAVYWLVTLLGVKFTSLLIGGRRK